MNLKLTLMNMTFSKAIRLNRNLLLMLLCVPALFLMSCGNDSGDSDAENLPLVKLTNNNEFGEILTNGNDVTLYFFANDADGSSTCEGACLNSWPVFGPEEFELGEGLNRSDFDEITRGDGSRQVTYKGWPLYYYSPGGDGNLEGAGQTLGDGVGNVWFVAKPDYSIMMANAQLTGVDGNNYRSDYTEGTGLTPYFVSGNNGRTIYLFTNDSRNTNTFTAEGLGNNGVWPIFFRELESVPSIVNKDDFGKITVHGQEQLTYKGWPLYYFGQDTERGDNKGVSVPRPGVWPIVNTNTPDATDPEEVTVRVQLADNEDLGDILTNGNGNTLYFFANDTKGVSTCEGNCLNRWPVFAPDAIELGEGLDQSDFGEITRGDENPQVTYKGWPLYYYSPDADGNLEEPGETLGEGQGNIWFVAKPDYAIMMANAQLTGADGKNYRSDYTEGTGLTPYFVSGNTGRTIYIFNQDSLNTNTFTKADDDPDNNNGVWPIFFADLGSVQGVPSILNDDDFETITVHGRDQLTYKGWPLYYYVGDTERGDNKGVSVPNPGAWPVVNTDTPNPPSRE